MIYQRLYARATTHSGLSALIGTRCTALRRPQDTSADSMVIQQVSGRENTQQGLVGEQRWQMTLYSSTYAGVKALAVQTKAAFDAYASGDGTDTIKWMRRVNETDLPYDEIRQQYRTLIDYMVAVCE